MASTKTATPIAEPQVLEGNEHNFRHFSHSHQDIKLDKFEPDHLLSLGVTGSGKNFSFEGEQKFVVTREGKENKVATEREFSLLSRVQGKTFQTCWDEDGHFRVWTNWGNYNLGKDVNITSKLKTNTDLTEFSGWVGAEYSGENVSFQARLETKDNWHHFLNEKTTYRHKDFTLGYAIKISLANFTFRRYDLFASYKTGGVDIFAQHKSKFDAKSPEKFSLGKILFGAVYKWKDVDFAGLVSYKHFNPVGEKVKVLIAGSSKINDKTQLQAQIDSTGLLSTKTEFDLTDQISLSASTQINLKEPKSYVRDHLVPVPIGFGINFKLD